MEQRVSMIALGVADLARAKAFYEGVVGWRAAEGPPEIVFFDLGGVILSLYPHGAFAKEMTTDPAAVDTANAAPVRDGAYEGFALAHNARSEAEVDAIFARLQERGATILKPPERVFLGRLFRLFRRPRRPQLGGRLQPVLDDRRRRPHRHDAALTCGRYWARRKRRCRVARPTMLMTYGHPGCRHRHRRARPRATSRHSIADSAIRSTSGNSVRPPRARPIPLRDRCSAWRTGWRSAGGRSAGRWDAPPPRLFTPPRPPPGSSLPGRARPGRAP